RAQIDRKLYKKNIQEYLFNYPNLTVKAGSIHDILMAHQPMVFDESGIHPIYGEVQGVKLDKHSLNAEVLKHHNLIYNLFAIDSDEIIYAPKIVLTTGTFLK